MAPSVTGINHFKNGIDDTYIHAYMTILNCCECKIIIYSKTGSSFLNRLCNGSTQLCYVCNT